MGMLDKNWYPIAKNNIFVPDLLYPTERRFNINKIPPTKGETNIENNNTVHFE